MNMKNVNPIPADVLTALQAVQLYLAGTVSEGILSDILWGIASCDGEAYATKKETLPIVSVIALLNEHDCDIDCEMRLSDKEIEEYGPKLRKLIGKEKQTSETVSKLLRGMKAKGTLTECSTVALCILDERQKMIKKHEAQFIASMMYRPIILDWKSDPAISAAIEQIAREYLSAFKTPGKIKWKDNVEDWEFVKQRLLRFLDEHYEGHTVFWTDSRTAERYEDSSRFDEGLLALESENFLIIEDMDTAGSEIRWRVRLNPNTIALKGDLPVYRGLKTNAKDKKIWKVDDRDARPQSFKEGYILYVWIYLLRHIGRAVTENELQSFVDDQIFSEKKKGKFDISNALDNLIDKLKNVSREPRDEVGSWFERGEGTVSLKSE